MDKPAFYADLRRRDSGLFGTRLSEAQVATCEAILDAMQGQPIPHIAYTMATAYHEPGPRSRMEPNRESLYYTTAARIAQVWPSRFTAASAQAYTRNSAKLANKVYNGRLGNRNGSNDGFDYRGGGLDHLTGRAHYTTESKRQGVDLVGNPDLILVPKVAVSSLVHGMTTGRYRGKKLADYHRGAGYDYVAARNIVNADSKTNGRLIAKYAGGFERALRAAGHTAQPAFKTHVDAPKAPKAQEVPQAGGFGAFIALLVALFTRKAQK